MVKNKNPLLSVNNLSVAYGAINALRDVSLEVYKGEIVVLIGANGAGKTTLLNTIIGMVPRTKGEIFFNDKEISNLQTNEIIKKGVCLLPEGRGIIPKMLVWENLQLGGYYSKSAVIKENMKKVFDLFPILREKKIQEAGMLSGGQQQILAIGRGIMAMPKLMLLDEPSLGLAPVIIKTLFNIIKDLNKEGYTIILSEQNARQALTLSDRGYVFEKGEIVLSGLAEDLIKNGKLEQAYMYGHVQ